MYGKLSGECAGEHRLNDPAIIVIAAAGAGGEGEDAVGRGGHGLACGLSLGQIVVNGGLAGGIVCKVEAVGVAGDGGGVYLRLRGGDSGAF